MGLATGQNSPAELIPSLVSCKKECGNSIFTANQRKLSKSKKGTFSRIKNVSQQITDSKHLSFVLLKKNTIQITN